MPIVFSQTLQVNGNIIDVLNIRTLNAVESSSGPDLIATRILKKFAVEFAFPVAFLCRRILRDGSWPSNWKIHWVLPLHKKKSKACPAHYRGIHLTSQLSKVIDWVNYV